MVLTAHRFMESQFGIMMFLPTFKEGKIALLPLSWERLELVSSCGRRAADHVGRSAQLNEVILLGYVAALPLLFPLLQLQQPSPLQCGFGLDAIYGAK